MKLYEEMVAGLRGFFGKPDATEVPFSNKKMVDKDEIERLIDAINQSLPNELESACLS